MSLDPVKAFEYHGVQLGDYVGAERIGDCFLCGKESHLFLNTQTGQWDCKRCGEAGNVYTFFDKLGQKLAEQITQQRMGWLVEDRQIPAEWLRRYSLGWNPERRSYTMPVRNHRGAVVDLLQWFHDGEKIGKAHITATNNAMLMNVDRLTELPLDVPVWVTEGHWDCIAADRIIHEARGRAVPICTQGGTFKAEWITFLRGRPVYLIGHNDPAGMRRDAKLGGCDGWPKPGDHKEGGMLHGQTANLKYVHWPRGLAAGYDVRDLMKDHGPRGAYRKLLPLFKTTHPMHDPEGRNAAPVGKRTGKTMGPPGPEPLPNRVATDMTFAQCLAEYGRWLEMTPRMVDAMRAMFAVVASTPMEGAPLWLYFVGPPGSGKTELLLSLSEAGYCVYRSGLTPKSFISGAFGTSGDPSLLPKLNGRTFVLKDATEILSMDQKDRALLFGMLRGAYDGVVQWSYGTDKIGEYKPVHFSMLAGVTHEIYGHADEQSVMGERFLKLDVSPTPEESRSMVRAAIAGYGRTSDMAAALQTAGTLFADACMKRQKSYRNETPEWLRTQCELLGVLTAWLRGSVRWSWQYGQKVLQYLPSIETGTRPALQFLKLSHALAIVDGKSEPDRETFGLVKRVAQDSARGMNLNILRVLLADPEMRDTGYTAREVADEIGLPLTTLNDRFQDMDILKLIVTTDGEREYRPGRPKQRWIASPIVRELWEALL